jgi:hypothetical protein
MTWAARHPAYLLAGSVCVGLAAANAWRVHGAALAGSAVAAGAVVTTRLPLARLTLVALVLLLAAWWWGSARDRRRERACTNSVRGSSPKPPARRAVETLGRRERLPRAFAGPGSGRATHG